MIPKSLEPSVSLKPTVQLPHLSLSIPFSPRTAKKEDIGKRLKVLLEKAKAELENHSAHFLNKPVVQKLEEIFQTLDYNSPCKSLYISLSPFSQDLYYLNIPVKEFVTVNGSFGLYDVAKLKKEEKNYLVLALDRKGASIYHGNNDKLALRVFNKNPNDDSFDITSFLKGVTANLNVLRKAFPFPVVVVGSANFLTAYRSFSKQKPLAELVLDHLSEASLQEATNNFLQTWEKLKQKHLLHRLEETLQKGKLEVGINDVWRAAKERKPILLVVEEGYTYPSYLGPQNDFIYADAIPLNSSVHVHDAVADAVEKVLVSGGDVEIVPKGMLQDFMHIALILA